MKAKSPVIVFISFLLLAGFSAGQETESISVPASDPHIQYEGRIGQQSGAVREIYWPGSSIKIKFSGSAISAVLSDQHGLNFYNIILDEDSIRCIRLDSVRREYLLASGLTAGEHTIELFRRNGWTTGITRFYGFEIPGGSKLLNLPEKKRNIEFYGNSITVGSAIYPEHSVFGDENNYESYAAITARHFDAGYRCIARSGIGLMLSWFPMTMPEMYNRLNPADSGSRWNFSRWKPGLVVINLLQNDYALFQEPKHPEFIHRFGQEKPSPDFIVRSYAGFVRKVRSEYPEAAILCVLGSMDAVSPGSPWPHYIEQAVSSLKDPRTYTYIFRYKNTPGHPDVSEHREMAQNLIRYIQDHISW